MSTELNKIAESLFEKIRSRFEDVSLGDENAKATEDPEEARFFNFDYVADGKNHGNITISLIDERSLKIYFSKNISSNLAPEEKQSWTNFLRDLRFFAKRNLLNFEPRDITRNTLKHRDIHQVSKDDSSYSRDEIKLGESRLYGTHRSSYENEGPVRIIVRHTDAINPEQRGARSRHIKSIFVENSEGERLKLPYNNLRYARAMARHISEGGMMHDDFGQHITRIAEECSKLRPFKNAMRRRTFEDEETQAMVESAFEYHGLLNDTLLKMSSPKGYKHCKENYIADDILMDDFDVDSLRERFVKRTYNDKLNDALPLVQKAYEMKKSNKFSQQFESWANNVAENWDEDENGEVAQWGAEPINIDELVDLFSDEIPVGVDGVNAIGAIRNIINSDELEATLTQASAQDPQADARDIIADWLQDNVPAVYQELMNEVGDDPNYPPEQMEGDTYGSAMGGVDGTVDEQDGHEDGQVDSITSAIVRRILNNIGQHSALLRKAGPDGILNAARDVASFHVPVEELGTSDISNMVREVYLEVGVPYAEESEELDEGKMKEVSMDLDNLTDEEFKAKYGKTKEEMKAALSEDMQDYVNRDEKLKRIGAKPLSTMDKIKNIPHGMRAMAKGEPESDLALYNKSKSNLEEMLRLAGLK